MAYCLNCGNYLQCNECAEKDRLHDPEKTPYSNSWIATVDAIRRSMFSFEDQWGESFDPNDFLPHLAVNGIINDEDYYKISEMPKGKAKRFVSSTFKAMYHVINCLHISMSILRNRSTQKLSNSVTCENVPHQYAIHANHYTIIPSDWVGVRTIMHTVLNKQPSCSSLLMRQRLYVKGL